MKEIKVSEVRSNDGRLHLESLSLDEAKLFIKNYHSDYGVILELYEVSRVPNDHTKKRN